MSAGPCPAAQANDTHDPRPSKQKPTGHNLARGPPLRCCVPPPASQVLLPYPAPSQKRKRHWPSKNRAVHDGISVCTWALAAAQEQVIRSSKEAPWATDAADMALEALESSLCRVARASLRTLLSWRSHYPLRTFASAKFKPSIISTKPVGLRGTIENQYPIWSSRHSGSLSRCNFR